MIIALILIIGFLLLVSMALVRSGARYDREMERRYGKK